MSGCGDHESAIEEEIEVARKTGRVVIIGVSATIFWVDDGMGQKW